MTVCICKLRFEKISLSKTIMQVMAAIKRHYLSFIHSFNIELHTKLTLLRNRCQCHRCLNSSDYFHQKPFNQIELPFLPPNVNKSHEIGSLNLPLCYSRHRIFPDETTLVHMEDRDFSHTLCHQVSLLTVGTTSVDSVHERLSLRCMKRMTIDLIRVCWELP